MGPHDISCFGAVSIPAGNLAGEYLAQVANCATKFKPEQTSLLRTFLKAKLKQNKNLHPIFMETQWQMHQTRREGEYKEVFELLAGGWVWQAIKSK